MIYKVLALALVVLWSAVASDTLTVRVFDNQTVTGNSALIRNIGQSQHLLYVRLSDSGGTCTVPVGIATFVLIYLEGGFDGVNYFPISPRSMQVAASGSIYEGLSLANGLFPYLRARLDSTYTNCRLDAWYTGSISPAAYPQLPPATATGYYTQSNGWVTAGARRLLVDNSTAFGRVVVYGVIVSSASATPNSVIWTWEDGGCTGTPIGATFPPIYTASVGAQVLPTGVVPYLAGPPGKSLCVETTAAVQINAAVVYRIE